MAVYFVFGWELGASTAEKESRYTFHEVQRALHHYCKYVRNCCMGSLRQWKTIEKNWSYLLFFLRVISESQYRLNAWRSNSGGKAGSGLSLANSCQKRVLYHNMTATSSCRKVQLYAWASAFTHVTCTAHVSYSSVTPFKRHPNHIVSFRTAKQGSKLI